jgi:hypothetical protein
VILAGFPPIVVGYDVIHYGRNVPFMDQWELVPLLAADADGRLRFASLWAKHNEHRLLLPRLLMIAGDDRVPVVSEPIRIHWAGGHSHLLAYEVHGYQAYRIE